jgi:2-methylcitrate dehydratase PrpD
MRMISNEQALADFVANASLDDFSPDARAAARNILLAVLGAGIAGASEEGCEAIRKFAIGGDSKGDATVFFSGAKAPIRLAALANGFVCRALDYCDGMVPGLHVGSSIVPVGLALAEQHRCSGRELLTALAVGAEIGARFNLSEAEYHGFDPTGVAGVFGAVATACRLKKMPARTTLQAMALGFNRAGGSFQSNVDGSLAVRLIQGWVAESGLMCADLAEIGITGPANFLDGVYGYRRLFAVASDSDHFVKGLGREFRIEKTGFTRDETRAISVSVPPYAHKLVGHEFKIGDNPRVNAQFSIQFCVANALLHGSSELSHFRPEAIARAEVLCLARSVAVRADPALDARGHAAVDMQISLASGKTVELGLDVPDGHPARPLAPASHAARFNDCIAYSAISDAEARGRAIFDMVAQIEEQPDVHPMIELLSAR